LDRYVVIEVEYDLIVENRISGNTEWAQYVQKVRAAVEAEKVRHIVSPRASIYGARLLATGAIPRDRVEEMCIWKGLDAANRGRVLSRMGSMS
jgi:hypothetical protein